MRPNTNSIATSIFVFDYENKGSASQCANVIESIFDTHIATRLEEVITQKIPNEMVVHLDTIEIDIGTIMETELDHELPDRIKNAFEIALNTKLNLLQQNGSSRSLSWSDGSGTIRSAALELYLTRGYLPNWIEAGPTLNALIKTMLEKSKSDLIRIIQKYSNNKTVLKRLHTILAPHDEAFVEQIWSILNSKNIGDSAYEAVEILEVQKSISQLNKGETISPSDFSEEQLIAYIKNQKARRLLLKKLKPSGVKRIFELCYKNEASKLLAFITSFFKATARLKVNSVAKELPWSVTGLSLMTLLIFEKRTPATIDFENYFLLLASIIGIEKSRIQESAEMLSFIENQNNLDSAEIRKRLSDTKVTAKIEKSKGALIESITRSKDAQEPKNVTIENDRIFDRNRMKIIKFYLTHGYLPDDFQELRLSDVQDIFEHLLEQKAHFLAGIIRTQTITDDLLIKNIQTLVNKENSEGLSKYLHHHFEKTHDFVTKTMAQYQAELQLNTHLNLDAAVLYTMLMVGVMIRSNGKHNPHTILDWINLRIKPHLPNEIIRSAKYAAFLQSQRAQVEQDNGLRKEFHKEQIANKEDEVISDPNTDKETNLFRKTITTNDLELEERIRYKLSILRFYTFYEFLPWWSDEKSLGPLLKSFEGQQQSFDVVFETVVLQGEVERPFLGNLAAVLPDELSEIFGNMLHPYKNLYDKWQALLAQHRLTNSLKNIAQSGAVGAEIQSADTPDAITLNDKNVLKKGIYFLEDEELLKKTVFNREISKGKIAILLKLAPYFYFRNLTPQKWRQNIYTFALSYGSNPYLHKETNLHSSFYGFLKKEHSDIPWDTILMAVYRNTKRSPIAGSMAFPPELLALIEKSGNKKKLAVDMDKERSEPTLDDGSTNEIRINNAGLIIIWPFLTRLFEQLSMVKNGQFVDSSMQMRAIYALQYFVFGAVDYPEYELVLNKILVGMPIQEHLSPPENLSVEESKTIESLMNGLIQNWPKVHDSSPEGIQETFLQREGILSLGPENYKLTIPKKTVDILVESIPWNLSLIKLPWMQKPLHIEWV